MERTEGIMMGAIKAHTTAEEFWQLCKDGRPRELVRGEVRELTPAGGRHGRITARIIRILHAFAEDKALGVVYGAETGFVLRRNPDTVRAADVGFVRKERFVDVEGFVPVPPDLAVEVISPTDLAKDIESKVQDYLEAGTQVVWVVYPDPQRVHVYSPDKPGMILGPEDILEGGEALPGFSCRVKDFFP